MFFCFSFFPRKSFLHQTIAQFSSNFFNVYHLIKLYINLVYLYCQTANYLGEENSVGKWE